MINKAILIGNLGRDPEMKFTSTGTGMCTFSIATTESYTKDGEKVEQTEWHNIVAWGKLAEICGQYLNKGSKVYIEGKLQTRSWEQDGVKKYKTEIVARDMKMLSPRGSEGNQAQHGNDPGPLPDPTMGDDVPF